MDDNFKYRYDNIDNGVTTVNVELWSDLNSQNLNNTFLNKWLHLRWERMN